MADLCVGGLVMPFAWYQLVISNSMPDVFSCKMWIAVDVTCSTASCLSLMIVSIDRCFLCLSPVQAAWYDHRLAYLLTAGMKTRGFLMN